MRRRSASLVTASLAVLCSTAFAGPPSSFETEVVAALNVARQQPASLIPPLQAMLPNFHGTMLMRDAKPSLATIEGAPAVQQAIDYLKTATACGALIWNEGLARAARDLVADQSVSGKTGHVGSDESFTDTRVNRYGEWRNRLGENIVYGSETSEAVALDTIIDDGVTDRGHRTSLFDCTYRVVGVACGDHPWYRRMCVMVFAEGMTERPALTAPAPDPVPLKPR